MGQKVGQKMTPEQRADYLKPFTLTSILKEEIGSLSPCKVTCSKKTSLIAGKSLEF